MVQEGQFSNHGLKEGVAGQIEVIKLRLEAGQFPYYYTVAADSNQEQWDTGGSKLEFYCFRDQATWLHVKFPKMCYRDGDGVH